MPPARRRHHDAGGSKPRGGGPFRSLFDGGGCPAERESGYIREKFLLEELFRQAPKRIMIVPIPARDPVTGKALEQWLDAPPSVNGGWNDVRDGLDAAS